MAQFLHQVLVGRFRDTHVALIQYAPQLRELCRALRRFSSAGCTTLWIQGTLPEPSLVTYRRQRPPAPGRSGLLHHRPRRIAAKSDRHVYRDVIALIMGQM